MSDERVNVSVEDAMKRLAVIPDYDAGAGPEPCVHTFRNPAFGLLGAHWDLESVRAVMEKHGVSESGPMATKNHHGLVVIDESGPLFLETRSEEA